MRDLDRTIKREKYNQIKMEEGTLFWFMDYMIFLRKIDSDFIGNSLKQVKH